MRKMKLLPTRDCEAGVRGLIMRVRAKAGVQGVEPPEADAF